MQDNFTIKNNEAIVKINKNIYDKQVLLQACYVKLDDAYFLVDEDETNYIISIKLKKEGDLKQAIYDFFDELIESASYIDQLKRTSQIRQTILEKALLHQSLQEDENNEFEK